MFALIPSLLLLPLALAGVLPPSIQELDTRAVGVVSPNFTCGTANSGYTCPSEAACCSQFGYCGKGDEFCLNSPGVGCQTKFSNATNSCYAPKSGVTISVDGTCGTTGVGVIAVTQQTTAM
ncbi:hypothetical protein B0T19DRAFT_402715 [Cercophora scortea]|uniref:Chitin-binding type-1 domain-containing protein n=1 Tax=Cercophora scortea TaxID=314031 RepID=A0AAE0MA09_9PEZI|nr:hypothetical protein B0T19DRAFT_402715 [Cercophora scortea]